MKVLVACEESQAVCTAFRERGHEAYSCDIQEPSATPVGKWIAVEVRRNGRKLEAKLSPVLQRRWLTNGEVTSAVMDNLFIFDCE